MRRSWWHEKPQYQSRCALYKWRMCMETDFHMNLLNGKLEFAAVISLSAMFLLLSHNASFDTYHDGDCVALSSTASYSSWLSKNERLLKSKRFEIQFKRVNSTSQFFRADQKLQCCSQTRSTTVLMAMLQVSMHLVTSFDRDLLANAN